VDDTASLCPNGEPDCIGLDAHSRTCTVGIVDKTGKQIGKRTFVTTPIELERFARSIPAGVRVGLEASTTGMAVCRFLRSRDIDVHVGAPRRLRAIADSDVKTDKRDSFHLAHLLQMNYFPECYVPPPEIEGIRQLVRHRMRLGWAVSSIKNQVIALVIKNLLQSRMEQYTDWFGKAGIQELVRLPFSENDKTILRGGLEQLKLLIAQEEQLNRDLAKLGESNQDVKILMTLPGIDFYSALGIVGEIGDVRRYPSKRHLCSDAGVVPGASNSGDKVSEHQHVKNGNKVLKYFLCTAALGMIKSNRETNVSRFYKKKAKQIGPQKARVAAARKIGAIIWKMLMTKQTYVDEDPALTERKAVRMARIAKAPPRLTSDEELQALADAIGEKEAILKQMTPEDKSDDPV
jgi:transposase